MARIVIAPGLWAFAALLLWLHLLAGIPGDYLGQGYPLYPGLKVSAASLGLEAGLNTAPVFVAAVLGRWLRLWVLPLVAAAWLAALDSTIQPFTIDFGTTWLRGEALLELAFDPLHTPLALAALMAASLWAFTRPRQPAAPAA
ncbi:hypothetical protein [Phaeovulum sp. NW3]|uniref:hypothetical protein n=1 Tax=Phaeovulum sp. NW3 TaxID=2934933 RepID=UPI002021BF3B|nr:hypothetical protein [Phaeovulum sp. NW3]MCL7463983.1 hypothetical protein [Phaeovulum sp. NW3]